MTESHHKPERNSTSISTTAAGVILVCCALVLNPFLLERTVSPDGQLDPDTRIAVLAADAVLLGFGMGALLLRRRCSLAGGAVRLARAHPNAFATALGVSVACAMLASAEAAFYVLNARVQPPYTLRYSNGDLHGYDPLLGYKPYPNHVSTITMSRNGEAFSEATYSFDRYGRRATPDGMPGPTRTRGVMVFGCSFVQGSGVNDDETLPNRIALLARECAVYNYGYGGYGPQQMLAQLEKETLASELEVSIDRVLYVYIPAHIRRAAGSMVVTTRWGRHFPAYESNAKGELVNTGAYLEVHPWRVRLFDTLKHEQIGKYFAMDFPPFIPDFQVEYAARLIIASRDRAVGRFGARFTAILWPRHPRDETDGRRILPYLKAAGVDVLDYTDLPEAAESGFLIPYDQHPAAEAHAILARYIVRDLEL